KSHTQKPGRQIITGHRFSLNKTSVVYEKTSPRSDLSEPTHGSNVDIPNIHECKQTLTSLTGQKKQRIDFSAGTPFNVKQQNLRRFKPRSLISTTVPTAGLIVMTSMIEFGSLFSPLFDEYFNGENQVVSKSSVVTTVDASDKRQQQPGSTSSTSTLAAYVTADGNFDL
ncbi:hypothetical protein Tco_1414944, partial [Tanacetum coccineum]